MPKGRGKEYQSRDEDVIYEPHRLNPEMVVDDKGDLVHEQMHELIDADEKDLLEGEGTERTDVIDMTEKEYELDQELERQQEKYDKKQKKKDTKTRIKGKKREIRHLKYSPAYEAGAKAKVIGSKIKEKRGTPEERKIRRQKIGSGLRTLSKMNEQSRGTLKKESKVRKKQTKKISKADTIDLIKGGRNKNLLSKSPGGSFNLINSNINKDFSQGNLVGKTGFSNKSNIFKKNNDAKKGSALMNENILGSATEKKGGKKIW